MRAPAIALISEPFARYRLSRVEHKLVLPPAEVVQVLVRNLTNTGPFAAMILVHDGRSGHSVTAHGSYRERAIVRYLDPWPEFTLLAADHNVAGVAATPDPKVPGGWQVEGLPSLPIRGPATKRIPTRGSRCWRATTPSATPTSTWSHTAARRRCSGPSRNTLPSITRRCPVALRVNRSANTRSTASDGAVCPATCLVMIPLWFGRWTLTLSSDMPLRRTMTFQAFTTGGAPSIAQRCPSSHRACPRLQRRDPPRLQRRDPPRDPRRARRPGQRHDRLPGPLRGPRDDRIPVAAVIGSRTPTFASPTLRRTSTVATSSSVISLSFKPDPHRFDGDYDGVGCESSN